MAQETLEIEGEAVHEEAAHEESGMHIQLAPEPAFQIGEFTVTNTMTATVFTTILIVLFALAIRSKSGIIPSRMQVIFEDVFMVFFAQFEDSVGYKKARLITPLVITLFMFVIVSNMFILIPLVGSFVTEHGHFFRTPTTDYSLTIALGLITMIASHLIAFVASPIGHIGNYIRIKPLLQVLTRKKPIGELFNAVIEIFLGMLEILGDFIKIISLGTRLFGNLLAGEVVLIVISGLMFATQFIIPIPFIILATFAGLIQAFVFTLLSTIFISNNLVHATHGGADDH